MPVFAVMVVEHPAPEDKKVGVLEQIVAGPTYVVATDSKAAALVFILGAKDTLKVDPIRAEVLVRPFA